MNRKTVYSALIAGVLLSAPVLPSAMAAGEDDMTSPAEVTDLVGYDQDGILDEGETPDAPEPGEQGEPTEVPQPGGSGRAPQGQAGPKYGPNIDGWVVKINYIGTNAGDLKVSGPGPFQNIASVSPSAGTALKPGMTTTVKGKPSSATSAMGGKAPANMDVDLVNGSGQVANISVRDSSGYSSPAAVSCTTVFDTNWKCNVGSSAKNQEIIISMYVNY